MNHPLRFDVFGRSVTVERVQNAWRVCHSGPDGTRRPADDIRLEADLPLRRLADALADLCHEWATPEHPEVVADLDPVFLYGTLKRDFPNEPHRTSEQLGTTWITVDAYPLMLCGPRCSPCLLAEPGAGLPVIGELHKVDLAGLERLDALERIDEYDGYRRRFIRVRPHGESGVDGEAGDDGAMAASRMVSTYLKARRHAPEPFEGPLSEYTVEHAQRYRARTPV